jgi:hypothetical protein
MSLLTLAVAALVLYLQLYIASCPSEKPDPFLHTTPSLLMHSVVLLVHGFCVRMTRIQQIDVIPEALFMRAEAPPWRSATFLIPLPPCGWDTNVVC